MGAKWESMIGDDPASEVLFVYQMPSVNGFPGPTIVVPRELDAHFRQRHPQAKHLPVIGVLYTKLLDPGLDALYER